MITSRFSVQAIVEWEFKKTFLQLEGKLSSRKRLASTASRACSTRKFGASMVRAFTSSFIKPSRRVVWTWGEKWLAVFICAAACREFLACRLGWSMSSGNFCRQLSLSRSIVRSTATTPLSLAPTSSFGSPSMRACWFRALSGRARMWTVCGSGACFSPLLLFYSQLFDPIFIWFYSFRWRWSMSVGRGGGRGCCLVVAPTWTTR